MKKTEIIEAQCKYCHYYKARTQTCGYEQEFDYLVEDCGVFEEEVKRMKPYFDKLMEKK